VSCSYASSSKPSCEYLFPALGTLAPQKATLKTAAGCVVQLRLVLEAVLEPERAVALHDLAVDLDA
jgi:hypothetical protein